jgi:diguanylate cyclase (GGDEF)-like protein
MRSRPLHPSTFLLAALIGGLGVFVLHTTLDFGGKELNGVFGDGVYNALLLGSAAAVLARGAKAGEQRPAWLAMGAGLLFWSLGELYYEMFIEGTSAEAGGTVSPADVLYLAMYPCFYAGVALLARTHLRNGRVGMWLDGLIAGLGAASVAAALILPPILDQATGAHSSIVVSLAYPIGDLLLTAFALGAIGITGWRPGGVWLLIAAAMLVSALADSTYLYQTSTDTYQAGTWLECLWPTAAVMLAIAAWLSPRRAQQRRMQSWQMMSVPALALLSALGVLVYGNLGAKLTLPAVILAAATVLAVGIHLLVTWRENLALLAHSRRLSLTDPLTGLGNRRRLMGDLMLACKNSHPEDPCGLVLYDLDGFKIYNDTFGHPAGDTLLVCLSERLQRAVESQGVAYRMGGDEFCVLFNGSYEDGEVLVKATLQALTDESPGFSITASHGVVRIPSEMTDPAAILQLADQRLYRRKEEVAALRSGDANDGEHTLPLGESYGGALAGATTEQGAGDRRIRRQPPL